MRRLVTGTNDRMGGGSNGETHRASPAWAQTRQNQAWRGAPRGGSSRLCTPARRAERGSRVGGGDRTEKEHDVHRWEKCRGAQGGETRASGFSSRSFPARSIDAESYILALRRLMTSACNCLYIATCFQEVCIGERSTCSHLWHAAQSLRRHVLFSDKAGALSGRMQPASRWSARASRARGRAS